jgi:membrane protein DedA with SNARE-associated domain
MNVLWRLAQLFRLPEQEVLKARDRFAQSADRAVFFGRFITFLRIFAGPLAGMAGMPYQRFLFFNIAGAITWGGVMVTLAYTAGRFVPLTVLAQYTLQFGMLALLVTLTWFALPWLKRSVSQNL